MRSLPDKQLLQSACATVLKGVGAPPHATFEDPDGYTLIPEEAFSGSHADVYVVWNDLLPGTRRRRCVLVWQLTPARFLLQQAEKVEKT